MNRRLAVPLAAAALALLSACASRPSLVPDVRQQQDAAGARTVSVAPERLDCTGGPRCPVLSASWTSAKKGQALLRVALPGNPARVTGADVHVGGSAVVRLRIPAQAGEGEGQPAHDPLAGAFDVPLRLVDGIAYTSRTWMRVYTADGGTVDEHIHSGEERSRAAEAMAHFMVAVRAAGGDGAGVEGPRGGLFDRLGVREGK